ncbi:MAG: ComEC/Rec2 family competence protein [Pyrinomonadaceae bacterium]
MAKTNFQTANKNFSQFPLLWLAICFAIGILAANFAKVPLYFWLTLSLIAITSATWTFFKENFSLATVFLFCAFAICGALSAEIENNSFKSDRISQIYDTGQITFQTPVDLTGVLQNEPEQTPDGYFLTISARKISFNQTEQTASGAVRVFLPLDNSQARREYENLGLSYGVKIKVSTRLTREDRFRNPGGTIARDILRSKNLDATGSIKNLASIQKLADAPAFSPLAPLYRWRGNLITQFKENFSIQTTGVLAASLLNNRYFLDKSTASRFREGGTFHVLVISGVHITFIGFLMVWLMQKLTRNVFAQFALANSLLWLFSIAVGAETPVMRAALMFTIFQAAGRFYRQNMSLNSLGATALVLLVWRPNDLFDQSWQLTFFSVTAIIAVAFPLLEKMREIGAWQPAEKTPVPPACAKWLKTLCETLFWSEKDWHRAQSRSIWKANLFKSELAKKLERLNLQIVWRTVFSAIFVSVVVTGWLLPLMANYFHRLSLISIFLNVFVGFLIAVESFVGIFALLVAQISPTFAAPFVAWTELFNYLLTYSAEPFIATKSAFIRLPIYTGLPSAIYYLYYAPLIHFAIKAYRWNPFQLSINSQQLSKNRLRLAALLTGNCLLITVIVFHPFSAFSTNGRLRIDFLDVGQGDSALITTPNGTKILVDGGGRPNFFVTKRDENEEVFVPDTRSVGEAVVCEFLWEKGFDRVDFLLPTHADADHIDGLNDVAQNFRVQSALVGRAPIKNSGFAHFAETLEKRGIPWQKVARGDVFEIDNVRIEVLSPEYDANPNAPSDNNDSIVFRLNYGSRSFLFTGDIEAKTERFLLQQPETLASDVIKVAHHGSKTSSIVDFVRATKAKFAVISVGRESPFGHPHQQTLDRWQNAGAQVMTTGKNGTISFTSDGTDLQLETFCQ